jgi:hypothetical protein
MTAIHICKRKLEDHLFEMNMQYQKKIALSICLCNASCMMVEMQNSSLKIMIRKVCSKVEKKMDRFISFVSSGFVIRSHSCPTSMLGSETC